MQPSYTSKLSESKLQYGAGNMCRKCWKGVLIMYKQPSLIAVVPRVGDRRFQLQEVLIVATVCGKCGHRKRHDPKGA